MADPFILTDAILAAADEVEARYRAQWQSSTDFPEIGDFALSSPVDGVERVVRFHLTHGFQVKGLTVCGLRAPGHQGIIDGDGNTVVLNRGIITSCDLFQPILLHEICHALDPIFETEWHELNGPNRPRRKPTHEESCRYLHEQRAFPGMWIGRLRDEIAAGLYETPGKAVARFRSLSEEFNWFCIATTDLMDQTSKHIGAIVADLQGRRR